MAIPVWLDFTLAATQLLALGVTLALLGQLARASRTIAGAQVSLAREAQWDLRARTLRQLWASVAALLVATAALEMHRPADTLPDVAGHGAATTLPHPWEFALADGTDQAYAVLVLAGYVFLAQILIGLVTVTRRRPTSSRAGRVGPMQQENDRGAALAAGFTLLAGVLALVPLGVTGYLHLLAHLQPPGV